MRSKFKWIFTLLLALSIQFSFAQEKTVTGVVSDNTGPLPGANIVVKGTTRSAQTDFDGKYSYSGILSVQFNAKSNNNVFSIFPNPSELNGVYLNVNGADKTDVMVKIVDIAGKVLLSQQLNVLTGNQPLFISTAGIQSGVYILEVSTLTENKSFKLVLKN
jgi:hypothetical protein